MLSGISFSKNIFTFVVVKNIKKLILMKILCILVILFLGSFVFSQTQEKETLLSDSLFAGPTIDEEFEEEENTSLTTLNLNSFYVPTVVDSFFNAPAYDLYYFWDTTDIHPYNSKMHLYNETKTIVLRNENSSFVFPLLKNEITSDFGWRRWKYHYGIDLRVNVGDSVLNCFDGMVRIAKRSKSYGYTVVVRHYNGLETLYAHLSKLLVTPNQEIKAGELIGLAGNTGRSTGPHLHFEVRFLGGPINPHQIINFNNMNLVCDSIIINNSTFKYLEEVLKARYHTVRKGDTLSKIAKKYGVSVSRLCKLNGISRKKILRIGQKIRYT